MVHSMPKNPTLKERMTKVETKVEFIEGKVTELNDGQHAILGKIEQCELSLNGVDMKLTKFIVDHKARDDEREKITNQLKRRVEIIGGVLGIIMTIITIILLVT